MSAMSLPITALRDQLLPALEQGPVVISAPTGTGKSTEVPRWLPGRVLVVQPRRVACQAVAARMAQLENVRLGENIGYRVRDDDCSSPRTRILAVTPGIVLNQPALLDQHDTVIVDELHERRLDTDLIVAVLQSRKKAFVAMSATIDTERVADALGARLLSVEARTFPVEITYVGRPEELPSAQDLETQVARAVHSLLPLAGDVLVFLPGKAEITAVAAALASLPHPVLPLHGGLSLQQQSLVLRAAHEPRILLSTNVAETSVTVPGVRAVIDSGLVRRTVYHAGRSYLTRSAIAQDSADQRAGRAGRTAPGKCLRLWGKLAKLEKTTPPEIHRQSLIPLVMAAADMGLRPEALPFLDAPKDYALRDARERLVELGALAPAQPGPPTDTLTDRGQRLHGLPLDPWLSRLLVEAELAGCLTDAIDLVAMLEQTRGPELAAMVDDDLLEVPECDLCALITAIRQLEIPHGPLKGSLEDARRTRKRLKRVFQREAHDVSARDGQTSAPRPRNLDRDLLLSTVLRADPKAAHIARRRKSRLTFTNGGTELDLGKRSRATRWEQQAPGEPVRQLEALVVLSTMALSERRDKRLLITVASPVSSKLLFDLGLGEERVGRVHLNHKGSEQPRLLVESERIFHGKVLGKSEVEPEGELARTALTRLFMERRWFPKTMDEAASRLSRRALASELTLHGSARHLPHASAEYPPPPSMEDFILARLAELGVEHGSDTALLEPADLLPDDVPPELSPMLDERFPQRIDVGDCVYTARYDLKKRQVLLSIVKGGRTTPPPASYLPKFEGLRVFVEAGGSFHPIQR